MGYVGTTFPLCHWREVEREKTYFLPAPLSVAPLLVSFFACGSNLVIPQKGSRLPRMKLGRSCKAGRTFFCPPLYFRTCKKKRETTAAAHSYFNSYHANFWSRSLEPSVWRRRRGEPRIRFQTIYIHLLPTADGKHASAFQCTKCFQFESFNIKCWAFCFQFTKS